MARSPHPGGKRWAGERQVVRAIQVAFDLGEEVQRTIREEALQRGLNPPDRVREILGLGVSRRPKRPRLSISLSDEDLARLARQFGVSADDRIAIRQKAAEKLIRYVESKNGG